MTFVKKIQLEYEAGGDNVERMITFLKLMDQEFMPSISSRVGIEEYAQKITKHGEKFWVVNEGMDCGHCVIYANKGSVAFITSIGILPEYRAKGLASALLYEVEAFVKNKGFRYVDLEVNIYNEKAVKLYIKNGYNRMCKQKNKLIMRKKL